MGVTTTLQNITQKFKEWHSDTDKNGQHDRIYEEIRRQVSQLTTKINNNDKILATAIQKIINGHTINNIDNLDLSSISDLKFLQDQIDTINKRFGIPDNITVQKYIDDINAQNDNGAGYYNTIIHDTLILENIPDGANLNDYKNIGIYRCVTASRARSLSNSPVTSSFILITISQYKNPIYNVSERDNMVHQIIFQNHFGDTESGTTQEDGYRIYQRYYQKNNQTWTTWTELYGTHNTQVVTMQVEFSNNDGTKDYKLLTTK